VNDVAPLIDQDPDALQSLNDEIAEIEKVMRERRSEYNRDEQMQARYRELLELRLTSQKSNAA
jgi:hypothetical protein